METMGKIDEEPKTMIELLVEQRANSTQDVFRYNFSLIRDKLSKTLVNMVLGQIDREKF